jgi:hypothetical protein
MSDYFDHFDDDLEVKVTPRFESAAELSAFVHAGNATFTLESEKTGKRFTYRVQYPMDRETGKPDRSGIMFASALTGPDNTRNYSYFGNIKGAGRYELGRKSRLSADTMSVKVFEWFYRTVIVQQRMPEKLKVYHMGKCGRCGRALTVPSSIKSGIGPECAKKSEGF